MPPHEAHRKASGLVYGAIPYGYRRDGERLLPDRGQQATVGRLLSLRAEGYSYRRLCRWLASRAIPGPRGGAWSPRTVQRILTRLDPPA